MSKLTVIGVKKELADNKLLKQMTRNKWAC